jgi:hypothetical protein
VIVLVTVGCLGLTAFGRGAPAEDLVLDGKGLNDVSAAPGTSIKKSGEGVAIVALKDGGKYTVSMDGPGTLYLVGTDDYSIVEVISKTGDGDLVWVPPTNPHSARIGPTLKGRIDGKGEIRSGTEKEVKDLRSKSVTAAEPKQASRPGAPGTGPAQGIKWEDQTQFNFAGGVVSGTGVRTREGSR